VDQSSWRSPFSPPPLLRVVTGLPVVVPPLAAPLVLVVTGLVVAEPTVLPVVVAGVVPVVLAPLVFVLTGLAADGLLAAGVPATGALAVPVDFAAPLRLVRVVTGAAAADVVEFAGCAELPAVTADVGAAVVLRARLALVRGTFATAVVPAVLAVVPAVPATVVGELVPGWGGAPAAGVPERCGAVGFSCLTIQTVRRTIWVRTSTGAAGVAFAAGRSANVVNAPSATSVTAPAIVVAGVFRIRLLL
jgi:hypothetical protein